ncbi:hypothetical protein HDU93_004722, partial [Gonapodya sp. JEL0774]
MNIASGVSGAASADMVWSLTETLIVTSVDAIAASSLPVPATTTDASTRYGRQ